MTVNINIIILILGDKYFGGHFHKPNFYPYLSFTYSILIIKFQKALLQQIITLPLALIKKLNNLERSYY